MVKMKISVTFVTKFALERRLLITTHQTYECPDCGKTIKMNSTSHHESKCSPKEKKSFACSECPYEVDRQDRLKPEYGLPLCHHLD